MIMYDWRLEDAPEPGIDARPWSVEIRESSEVALRIEAACPKGTKREVWIEIQDGKLVVHAYDPEHEEPVNLRVSRTGITVDSDRDEALLNHYDPKRHDEIENLLRRLAQQEISEELSPTDVDNHVADLGEEELFGAYHILMEFARSAREFQR